MLRYDSPVRLIPALSPPKGRLKIFALWLKEIERNDQFSV